MGRDMTEIRDPADCTTMTEVRAGVDDVDRQVVALLKRRFGYMDAAARIKPDRSAVRDEWRKADVLAKVDSCRSAHRHGPLADGPALRRPDRDLDRL